MVITNVFTVLSSCSVFNEWYYQPIDGNPELIAFEPWVACTGYGYGFNTYLFK
jgi:hypothetical protein